MAGFQFIVTDDRGQTRRDDRRTIRSQCMKGKNTKTKTAKDAAATAVAATGSDSQGDSPPAETAKKARAPAKRPVPVAGRRRARTRLGSGSGSGSGSAPAKESQKSKAYSQPGQPAQPGQEPGQLLALLDAQPPALLDAQAPALLHTHNLGQTPGQTQTAKQVEQIILLGLAVEKIQAPPQHTQLSYPSHSHSHSYSHSHLHISEHPHLSENTHPQNPSDWPQLRSQLALHTRRIAELPSDDDSDFDLPTRTRFALTSPDHPVRLTETESRVIRAATPQLELTAMGAGPRGCFTSTTAMTPFAATVDAAGCAVIHTFFSVAQQMIYPATVFVDFEASNSEWWRWLFEDTAYLHASLALMMGVRNVLNGREHGRNIYGHVVKSLRALHARIGHEASSRSSISNSTVAVVLSLIVVADMLGDDESAKSHFDGLCRMVSLRGGLDGFRQNAKMHIKLGRFDLGAALDSGAHSKFSSAPVPYASMHPRPLHPSSPLANAVPPSIAATITDDRLLIVFEDMAMLAMRVNLVHGAQLPKISDAEFQNHITSVQYRLLQLHGEMPNIHDECLRLTLLAVLATTYPLPGTRIRYPFLARNLRNALTAIQPLPAAAAGSSPDSDTSSSSSSASSSPPPPAHRTLILWALLVGTLAVFDVSSRPWTHSLWQALDPPRDWPEMLAIVQSYVWFRPLHDRIGRRCFDRLWAAVDIRESIELDQDIYSEYTSGFQPERRWCAGEQKH